MSFEPIFYKSQLDYERFVKNLLTFNRRHLQLGRLVIEKNGVEQLYTVKVKEKDNWFWWLVHLFYKPKTERSTDLTEFTWRLFDKNKTWAKKDILLTLRAISAVETVFAFDETSNTRWGKLKKELEDEFKAEKLKAQKAFDEEKRTSVEAIQKEAKSEIDQINQKCSAEIRQIRAQSQAELESIQREIENAEHQLENVQRELDPYQDTLFVAKDGPIVLNMQAFKEIPFLEKFLAANMGKMSITEEEKKTYPHVVNKFNFSDFASKENLIQLMDYVRDKKSIDKITTVQSLIDLYYLADYLQFASLKAAACNSLQDKLDARSALELLQASILPLVDPLTHRALTVVAKQFHAMSKLDEFKSISHEKMMALINNDNLDIDQEFQVYEALKEWIKHQPDSPDLQLIMQTKIGEGRFIDMIRFEHFTPEQIKTVLAEEVFTSQDLLHWSPRFLRGNQEPGQRSDRSESLVRDGLTQGMVKWTIESPLNIRKTSKLITCLGHEFTLSIERCCAQHVQIDLAMKGKPPLSLRGKNGEKKHRILTAIKDEYLDIKINQFKNVRDDKYTVWIDLVKTKVEKK